MGRDRGTVPARERWSRLVGDWRRSGLGRKEFAARAGVKPGTLSFWAWRLGREAKGCGTVGQSHRSTTAEHRGKFVELVVERGDEGSFVLALGDGRLLTIPPGFDADALSRLLATLEGAQR